MLYFTFCYCFKHYLLITKQQLWENQCWKFSPICNWTQNTFNFLQWVCMIKILGSHWCMSATIWNSEETNGDFGGSLESLWSFSFMFSSMINVLMIGNGTMVMTCDRWINAFFLPNTRTYFLFLKNSWLCWKMDLHFQRSRNDMWDTRQQEKLTSEKGRSINFKSRLETTIHKPREKRNTERIWQFTTEISRNIGKHSLCLESGTRREIGKFTGNWKQHQASTTFFMETAKHFP